MRKYYKKQDLLPMNLADFDLFLPMNWENFYHFLPMNWEKLYLCGLKNNEINDVQKRGYYSTAPMERKESS